jgi:N-methylhydantoinase A
MQEVSARYRLGVDVGGTHTDLVLLDTATGELAVEKVASTPKNPALGVLDGINKFIARGIAPGGIGFFAHGTTITTNALLEMRGAKVGLLITKGYRAVQEIQNQARDGNLFDYFYAKPVPIAPQSLTREIPERCDHAGNVLVPLDRGAVARAARELKAAGVESIAVCYLFSFMHPAHEQETRSLIAKECPGIHVSLSSEVLPRIREWPRLSTTLINAYLEPVMVGYIAHLDGGLNKLGLRTAQRFLMQSNGGVMPFSAVIAGGRTVHTLFSGPAAGAQASAYLAGSEDLVTLDMGGTSADIACIEGGAPLEVTEGVIARRQVDVPALDMTTISAGGGSIAWVDRAGFLNVGPQSAGADPGPACYGRGGAEPTVTDADLVCGFLNPDYFLGGAQHLDIAASRAALDAHVAKPLRMDITQAAAGIARIVDMRMADAIRVFAAKRGVDLTHFTLLPFGGAGAVHATAVARELGMRRILVPPRPGAFSALGLLCSDVVHDYIRSEPRPLAEISAAHADGVFGELEAKARQELAAEGMDENEAELVRELDLRYAGQGYELRTPLAGLFTRALTGDSLLAVRKRFDERHAQIHGHSASDRPVEVVSYRLRARVRVPKYETRLIPPPKGEGGARGVPRSAPGGDGDTGTEHAIKGQRDIWLDGKQMTAVLYERDRLDVGASIIGPAIIEQFDATTVIAPGWHARVDGYHNLVLTQ